MKWFYGTIRMALLGVVGLGVLGSSVAAAAVDPIEGYWKNIDDKEKKPKAVIKMYQVNGQFYGKIVKLYRKAPDELCPKCDKCTEFRKDRPVCGITMVWALKKTGNDYSGGKILDPNNGKVYGAKMWIDEKDKSKLHVRGYLFVFFRTQNWFRVPEPKKNTCALLCSGKKTTPPPTPPAKPAPR